MAPKLIHRAAQNILVNRAIGTLGYTESRRPNLLRVLTYHRIDDGEAFRRQMEYVVERYHLPSCDQIGHALRGGQILAPRALLVTFDDAHKSFGEKAWPVLQKLGIPTLLFVPTGFPDHPERTFWWERLRHAIDSTRHTTLESPVGKLPLTSASERTTAFRTLRDHLKTLVYQDLLRRVEDLARDLEVARPPSCVHSRSELLEYADQGCVLGAHTVTHPLLDDLPFGEARREVTGSLQDLQRWTGRTPRFFAYPDGRYDGGVVDAVREAGFVAAFTTVSGTNDLSNSDPLLLRRIHCTGEDSVSVLRARLLYGSALWNGLRPVTAAGTA